VGNRLPHGLGGRGHWLDMLGGHVGQVNEALKLPTPEMTIGDKSRGC
jgi:hypothetical protein